LTTDNCLRKEGHIRMILKNQQASVTDMPRNHPTAFGRHLLDLRKARGWSQPELAKQVGISDAIIGRYERGAATPSVDIAKRLADALGVTLDHLVSSDTGPNPLQDKAAYERCKALAALPEEDKNHAFYLIDIIIRDARARLTYGS